MVFSSLSQHWALSRGQWALPSASPSLHLLSFLSRLSFPFVSFHSWSCHPSHHSPSPHPPNGSWALGLERERPVSVAVSPQSWLMSVCHWESAAPLDYTWGPPKVNATTVCGVKGISQLPEAIPQRAGCVLEGILQKQSEEWLSSVVLLLSGLQLPEINPLVIHHGCVYPCDIVWSVFSHLTQEGYGSKERIVYIPNGNWVFGVVMCSPLVLRKEAHEQSCVYTSRRRHLALNQAGEFQRHCWYEIHWQTARAHLLNFIEYTLSKSCFSLLKWLLTKTSLLKANFNYQSIIKFKLQIPECLFRQTKINTITWSSW